MKADLIFTADWHIRDSTPESRTDDFVSAMTTKLQYIKELQEEHECPVLIAGDVFDHWKPSPKLISYALENMPDNVYAIPGNHDLPAHSLENVHKSGIHALSSAYTVDMLTTGHGLIRKFKVSSGYNVAIHGFPYGVTLENITPDDRIFQIAVVHKFIYDSTEPFPGASEVGCSAKNLIKQLNNFDIIITGDNHQTFTRALGDTVLVNPGSLMRSSAIQINHKPCVFLWYAETQTIKQVQLPINKSVISRDHLESAQENLSRRNAFIEKLDTKIEISNSFESNMKSMIAKNNTPVSIQSKIWGAINGQ